MADSTDIEGRSTGIGRNARATPASVHPAKAVAIPAAVAESKRPIKRPWPYPPLSVRSASMRSPGVLRSHGLGTAHGAFQRPSDPGRGAPLILCVPVTYASVVGLRPLAGPRPASTRLTCGGWVSGLG